MGFIKSYSLNVTNLGCTTRLLKNLEDFVVVKLEMAENKKAEQCSAFSPNLTMNLTYLCYGSVNVYAYGLL